MTTRSTIRAAPLFAALAAALAACDQVPSTAVTKCDSAVSMGAAKTDILFVIDDSGSMSEEQAALKDSLFAFIDGLKQSGIQNDFQIGVTNTSVTSWDGTALYPRDPDGTGPIPPLYAYDVPYPAGRLVAIDPGALTSRNLLGRLLFDPAASAFIGPRILPATSPTLQDDFKANVLVGTIGSGKEQPFRAARQALEAAAPGGANAGFLRPGARLAVVFLSDEDDCSESKAPPYAASTNDLCHDAAVKSTLLDSVADFVTFLDGPIDGEPRTPLVATIAGFDRTSLAATGCATSFDAPDRFAALVAALGADRTVKASICEPRFEAALQQIADRLVPQTVPLDGALDDVRMLVATVTKPDGSVVGCPVAKKGTPEAATAGAVYDAAPLAGGSATVTFQGACTLHTGYRVDLRLVCAG